MIHNPQNNVKIDHFSNETSEIKFSNITINNTLYWKPHVDEKKKRLCKITGLIKYETTFILPLWNKFTFPFYIHIGYIFVLYGAEIL